MNQNAIVKGEVDSGVVEISLLRQVECSLHCGGDCSGCMQKPKDELLALASNPIGAKPGDWVEVESTWRHPVLSALLIFGLPCVGLALGYLAGQAVGLAEGLCVAMAVPGGLAGFLPALWVNGSMMKRKGPSFIVVKQLA